MKILDFTGFVNMTGTFNGMVALEIPLETFQVMMVKPEPFTSKLPQWGGSRCERNVAGCLYELCGSNCDASAAQAVCSSSERSWSAMPAMEAHPFSLSGLQTPVSSVLPTSRWTPICLILHVL